MTYDSSPVMGPDGNPLGPPQPLVPGKNQGLVFNSITGKWELWVNGRMVSSPIDNPAPSPGQPGGGDVPGQPPAAPATPAAPAADPTPAAPVYQHHGPTQGFSFGNLTGDQVVGYNDPSNRGLGWQKLTDYLNPNGTSANYGRWLNGQMGDQYQRFSYSQADRPKNSNNDWISYLEKVAPGMRNLFLGLSSSQTGNNYGNYESGNWLG